MGCANGARHGARFRRARARRGRAEVQTRTDRSADATARYDAALPRRLMKLNRIPVRIFDLDLPPAWSELNVVPEAHGRAPERRDHRIEILYVEHDPVPAPGFLAASIRHRTRTRAA